MKEFWLTIFGTFFFGIMVGLVLYREIQHTVLDIRQRCRRRRVEAYRTAGVQRRGASLRRY